MKAFDKTEANKQKDIIQDIAVQLLYKYRNVMLTWATGCGKTLGSLKMIKELHKHKPEAKGYIICKERAHLDNWKDDIHKHQMNNVKSNSHSFLYASLHKYVPYGIVDFLILDECHAITDKRLEYLKALVGPNTIVIMLSATVEYDKKILLRRLCGGIHEYHISMSKAIEMGILPVPTVYVHYFNMTEREKVQYFKMNTQLEEAKEKFDETDNDWDEIKIVNIGSERKRLIAEMKTERAKKLIEKEGKGFRYITFTGSKRQAMDLDPFNYIHSGRTKQQNLIKKNKFNEGKVNNLTVVKMFREAMNLVNINKGFIVQLDNVKLSFIQMLGRVFRSNMPEMHIMVMKDTKDEKYLRNVMKGFHNKYVNIVNH